MLDANWMGTYPIFDDMTDNWDVVLPVVPTYIDDVDVLRLKKL